MLKRCARLMTVGGLVVTLFACGESAGPTDTAGSSPAEALSATQRQFVGAWSLAGIERRGADGEPLSPPAEDRLGYLIYDAAGYMGVTIMRPDRTPYSEGGPTGEEALAQFGSYTSYFGRFTVNEADGAVTPPRRREPESERRRFGLHPSLHLHRRPLDPPAASRSRRFEDVVDLVTAARSAGGRGNRYAPATLRRVPHRVGLPPYDRRLRGRGRSVRERLPLLYAIGTHVGAPHATRPLTLRRRSTDRPTKRSA